MGDTDPERNEQRTLIEPPADSDLQFQPMLKLIPFMPAYPRSVYFILANGKRRTTYTTIANM
jgi:hypothetical protein